MRTFWNDSLVREILRLVVVITILVAVWIWMVPFVRGIHISYGTPTAAVAAKADPATTAMPTATTQAPATPNPVTLTRIIEINPCVTGAQPELQVEKLVENRLVVPNAFTGLDLNRDEVGRNVRYRLSVPVGAYTHLFVAVNDGNPAGNGLTYEVHGGDNVVAINTAFTIWCKAGNWNVALAGQTRVMNAKNLPTPLSDQWLAIPASGIMPVPPTLASTTESPKTAPPVVAVPATQTPVAAAPQATAPAKQVLASPCTTLGPDWFPIGENQCHIGPLAAESPLKGFTVPQWAVTMHWSLAGQAGTPAQPGETVNRLHEATLFFDPGQ